MMDEKNEILLQKNNEINELRSQLYEMNALAKSSNIKEDLQEFSLEENFEI